ncbi:hypothetical protein O181_095234 [Austropuccinia psidii MF-1]|uniref:Uncharacterized protein n=1 Tax=Austropuccinia psidii MF-1 TaxID=1389203 RepID=A0A9Q3J4Y0_9BASI|nr:hypothetical protein [Austropuccinia psidii MF-1]
MLVMLADKHTRNSHSLSNPSNHAARGVPGQDALARTPLWLTMMKAFPSWNGRRNPKQADRNDSRRLSQSPQVLICPPPLPGHNPNITSLLDRSKVIIQHMKDGNGERTFKLGLIVTMSCYPWDSNAKKQTNQIPRDKTLLFLVCLASKLLCNRPLAQVAPSGWRTYSAPPIPGLSPSSEPHEDVPTYFPHLSFSNVQLVPLHPTPSSPLTIRPSDPHMFPLPPSAPEDSTASSPHSHNDAFQELTDLQLTFMIPRAIVH